MEPVPTTFIPKKPLITKPPERKPIGIVYLIAIVLLLASVGLFGASYGYQFILKGQVERLTADLEKTQAAFEPRLLRELERADSRIEASEELLKKHITVLPVFDFFAANTLRGVRFKNFSYTYNSDTQKVDVRMNGEAKNFESIALQSDVFAASERLSDFFFTDLNPDASGRIIFNFSAKVDPLLVSYAESIKEVQQ